MNRVIRNLVYAIVLCFGIGVIVLPTLAYGEAYAPDAPIATDPVLFIPSDRTVQSATWNADGSYILTRDVDGAVFVYSAATGEPILQLSQDYPIDSAVWNQDGTHILISERIGILRIWELATQEVIWQFEHTQSLGNAEWSPDETRVLAWSIFGMTLIDIESKTILGANEIHGHGGIYSVDWSLDGSQLLVASGSEIVGQGQRGNIEVVDAQTGQSLVSFPIENSIVVDAVWSADETVILAATTDGMIHLWDATDDKIYSVQNGEFFSSENDTVLWSADERTIIVAGGTKNVQLWDAETGELRLTLPDTTSADIALMPSDPDKLLVQAFGDAQLWEYDDR